MIQFLLIETNTCSFIKCACQYNCSCVSNYKFDEKFGEKTFHSSYFKIDSVPRNITKRQPISFINKRFELKDPSFEREGVPKSAPESYFVESGGDSFKSQFAHLESLYEYKYDSTPEQYVPIEFELKILCKIDKIEDYGDFSYPVFRTQWTHEGYINTSKSIIGNYEIDKILFPDIILPSRPCFLTSKQSYDIVRAFVVQNIDSNYAKITSNYDFCFTVKKLIKESNEEISLHRVIGSKSKKSKANKNFVDSREIVIFEMTHHEHLYKGYTPIEGFKGSNQEDLKNKVDAFLKELLIKINTPLEDCPKCKGRGVLIL